MVVSTVISKPTTSGPDQTKPDNKKKNKKNPDNGGKMILSILVCFLCVLLAAPQLKEIAASIMTRNSPDISMTNDQFQAQILSYHNWFRNQHSANKLTWNSSIAANAEEWASNCAFRHSQAGQNLVAGFQDVAHSMDAWGLERQRYDWNQPGFGETTGHFTQVVWRDTTELGCGRKLCPAGTIFPNSEVWYIVCNYASAGNVVGDGPSKNDFFVENVGQQVSGSPSVGIVEHLSAAPDSECRRSTVGPEMMTSSKVELQARVKGFVGHMRDKALSVVAALAKKMF